MKKTWIIIVNIILMLVIIAFVAFYAHHEQQEVLNDRVKDFSDLTVAMERVTKNYLEGEQNICDVWAHHINSSNMTLEEATVFVRNSHVLADASAHLIYTDDGTYSGLSTRPRAGTQEDYAVSYANYQPFPTSIQLPKVGQQINVSRAYTNPMNGVQSITFYNAVTFRDEQNGGTRQGMLLRVMPISRLEEKWVFPQEEYRDAEFSLIDEDGSYIIKSHSLKNSNFFEFYKSYNKTDTSAINALAQELQKENGTFTMYNSRAEECLIGHTKIEAGEGWVLLSYLPVNVIGAGSVDWLLIGAVAAGLLLLFLFDLLYVMYFNRKLQEMAKQAKAANYAKTDFLSTMSHDIRTPMNAIIGLTTIAEKNLGDMEAVSDNLHKISLASNHLLTLINDILDISKVESGKLTLNPLTFSIVETVQNLVNLSQPMVKEKNIDFNFRINRMENEYLYADQLRLNQIYINLLSNAIKYTEPGGRVSVDMREEASEKPGCVRLSYIVADTGIGMTAEFMERMYQPFSRQTDSRVNTIQGTGLGLAITHQMVNLMNGSIDCKSSPGEGTTFTVILDLPIADRQLEDMELGPVDILLVDDDDVLLETTQDTLHSLGANAETASSGAEALERILRRHESGNDYDVVILDWKMPEMDGVELVQAIRHHAGNDIPILLISAYDWSDIEDAAKEAGANGFVSKPLFRSTLYEKISHLLGVQISPVNVEEDYSDLVGMRVLIAEDNDVNWEIVSMLLSMYGIESERAENGQSCVEKLRTSPPGSWELVFMDIQMPVMNGLDATRAIRALKDCWAADIPIIAMTADAFSENVVECLEAGMNGHIAKPIDIKLVLKEIKRIKEERK